MKEASTYLAYVKSTRPTGRVIARQLGTTGYGIKVPDFHPDVLIRWGSRKSMPRAAIELNRPDAIKLASDKVDAIKTMQDAGVYTVLCFTDFSHAAKHARSVVLGRSRTGFGGKDIKIYDPQGYYVDQYPKAPTEPHDWYSVYMQPSREVRIHVVGDKVVRVQGKYLDYPELAETNPFVRNYEHGYRFRAPDRELHQHRKRQAIEAVRALKLDFGAVDMLLFGSDRDAMILEVNTAAACSPLTARCYAAEIALLVQQATGGDVRLARGILEAEVADMPEESEDEERYIL